MIRLAILPGDGIGGEVLAGPIEILERLAAEGRVAITGPWPVGASAYLETGEGLPAETLAACEAADAILFGAVGDHPGFDAREYRPELALLHLREHFDLRISIRQIWLGQQAPLTIVRNLLGGAYGTAETRQESDGRQPAVDQFRLTPEQIREVVEIACDYGDETGALVSVDKANLLATSRLWRRIATQVTEQRALACRHLYVDQCAYELGKHGLRESVLVTEGLFGDILSDLAAARAGSIALCSSASINPSRKGRCVGLFEPLHGTAPKMAGKGIANPTGGYLALAAAFEWFPPTAELALVLRKALTQALEDGPVPGDIAARGAPVATTVEFARHVNEVFFELMGEENRPTI